MDESESGEEQWSFYHNPYLPLSYIIQQTLGGEDPSLGRDISSAKITIDSWKWRIHQNCYIKLQQNDDSVKIHVRNEHMHKEREDGSSRVFRFKKIKFNKLVSYGGVDQLEMIISGGAKHASNIELLESLTHYITPFFRVKNYDFKLDVDASNGSVTLADFYFIFDITKKFRFFDFFQGPQTSVDEFSQHYEFLQDYITVEEKLCIDFPNLEDVKFSHPLKQKNIDIHNANFIHIDCFMEMECEHLSIFRKDFSSADLNKILRAWIDGKMKKIRSLYVFTAPTFKINRNTVMKNIKCAGTHTPPPLNNTGDETEYWKTDVDFLQSQNDQFATVRIEDNAFSFKVMT